MVSGNRQHFSPASNLKPRARRWVVLSSALALWITGIQCQAGPEAAGGEAASARPATASTSNNQIDQSRSNAITRAVAATRDAVVGINVIAIQEYRRSFFDDDPFFRDFFPSYRVRRPVKGLGSGFLVSKDGYILTNEHVVANATEIVVTLTDGTEHQARVVGADHISDVALLKIEGTGFRYAQLGDSDDLIIGEWVIAIGNPFGLFDVNSEPSVTVGVVSSQDRDFGRRNSGRVYQDMIQTDASINPGNSGGPLVNSLGKVIGINTFIFTGSQSNQGSIGIGFAIPVSRVKRIMKELRTSGQVDRRFWSGLEVEELSPLIARFLGLKSTDGVIVTHVEERSPAARAGMQVGDVIVSVEGEKVRSVDDIWAVIENSDVRGGDTLGLRVFRKTKYLDLKIRLEQLQD